MIGAGIVVMIFSFVLCVTSSPETDGAMFLVIARFGAASVGLGLYLQSTYEKVRRS